MFTILLNNVRGQNKMSDENTNAEEKKTEEENTKEIEEEKPIADSNIGDRTEDKSPIEQAHKAAKRLEDANKETERIAKKNEKILAEIRLSGRSSGGSGSRAETPDEKWAREAKDRYAGTGMDPTPDDTPTTYS